MCCLHLGGGRWAMRLMFTYQTVQSLPYYIAFQTTLNCSTHYHITQSPSNRTVSVKLHTLPHYAVCCTTQSIKLHTTILHILPNYSVPYYTLPNYKSTKQCSLYCTTQSTPPECTVYQTRQSLAYYTLLNCTHYLCTYRVSHCG